jgi:hypothetical protein
MALCLAGAGGDPQIACLSLVSQALQASTDPYSSLMWFTRDVTVDRRLAAVA